MLIPSELRGPLATISAGLSLKTLFSANPGATTIGIAAAQSVPSVVSIGGVRAAAGAYASCAVAATRLEARGNRIFGALCSGMGLAAQKVYHPAANVGFSISSRGRTPIASPPAWRNSSASPLQLIFSWSISDGNVAHMPAGDYSTSIVLNPGETLSLWRYFSGWLNQNIGIADVQFSGTLSSPAWESIPVPDWAAAASALAWATDSLPWWGAAETAALSGSWVRRASWQDATRQIRFEPGMGTARSVLVQRASGQVSPVWVTSPDFGSAEFLGEDWQIISGYEPPAIDVTDLVFSGPAAAVFFAVTPASVTPPVGDPTVGDPTVTDPTSPTPLPTTGQGFLYLKNGTATLVPAKDVTGGPWEP